MKNNRYVVISCHEYLLRTSISADSHLVSLIRGRQIKRRLIPPLISVPVRQIHPIGTFLPFCVAFQYVRLALHNTEAISRPTATIRAMPNTPPNIDSVALPMVCVARKPYIMLDMRAVIYKH